MKPKESDVLHAVKQTLDVMGILYVRNNSGAAQTRAGRFLRFGSPGSADIIACFPGGRFVAIECKRPGEKPTPAQRAWLEKVSRLGGIAIAVDSAKSLLEQLKGRMGRPS
jgi:hypothetical protein